jgi:hypothetical protein
VYGEITAFFDWHLGHSRGRVIADGASSDVLPPHQQTELKNVDFEAPSHRGGQTKRNTLDNQICQKSLISRAGGQGST